MKSVHSLTSDNKTEDYVVTEYLVYKFGHKSGTPGFSFEAGAMFGFKRNLRDMEGDH